MFGPIVLMAAGLLLWVGAAHIDKRKVLEHERLLVVLLFLIAAGMGCVVAGAMWLGAIWMAKQAISVGFGAIN